MPRLRDAYLFQLARLCGLQPDEVDRLKIRDFANYIDNIDEWIKVELRMKEVTPLG